MLNVCSKNKERSMGNPVFSDTFTLTTVVFVTSGITSA